MNGRFSAYLANSVWQLSSWHHWRNFQKSRYQLQRSQEKKVESYLRKNEETLFGRQYDFRLIKSVKEYQTAVPLSTYDDYDPYITLIGAGEKKILTSEPVRLFELSSGSTKGAKLIPYTAALQSEFQAGIGSWIYHLFSQMPELKKGAAYWSITPLTKGKRYTAGGMPIGFEVDSAYLGLFGAALSKQIMAVPDSLKEVGEIDRFRYLTLFYLLRRADLRIISIWNPTFWPLLLKEMGTWWDQLLFDVREGRDGVVGLPERARILQEVGPDDWGQIWPELGLISCWMDGVAAGSAKQLATFFPTIPFQGKGLIATEGFISFPLAGVDGGVLSVDSHFFEFLPWDEKEGKLDKERPLLADQLTVGKKYGVVISTGGGLYRYQLQDLIEVTGWWYQLPTFRFVGKTDQISDWFGEKLSQPFVAAVLDQLWGMVGFVPSFALLAPSDASAVFRYCLFFVGDGIDCVQASIWLDHLLCQNFHYAYCRELGQLGEAVLLPVGADSEERYLAHLRVSGQRLGNIKPTCLVVTTGWEQLFEDC